MDEKSERVPIIVFTHGMCRKCGQFNVSGYIDPDIPYIVFDCDDCLHMSSIRLEKEEWESIHVNRGGRNTMSSLLCEHNVYGHCTVSIPKWLWFLGKDCDSSKIKYCILCTEARYLP